MKIIRLILLVLVCSLAGCAGTGFDKQTTVMPNTISVGYGQERFQGESEAWKGINISATWDFK